MSKIRQARRATRRDCRARRRLSDGPDPRPGARDAEHEERRLDRVYRRQSRNEVLAARSDQRRQLQQARGRLAVQDRQPRHAARVQARRHAARDSRRALRDGWHAPIGHRAGRPHGRADLVPQLPRRPARGDRPAPAVGPRRRVLDRRQERRAHPLRDDRLSADRAQREERLDGPVLRRGRRRRPEEGRGVRQGPADRSTRRAKSACTRRRRSSRTSSSSGRRSRKA